MNGAERALRVMGSGTDRATIIALAAYALVVAAIVAAPEFQGALPRVVHAPFRPRPPKHESPPVPAQELVTAPQFRTSQTQRTEHVNRAWRIVGGVGVNIVTVNPKARNVHIVLGLAEGTVLSEGRFGRESFGSMVRRFRPRVAIDGTYFDLRSNEPVGALVMENRLIYDGLCSGVLLVTEQGDVRIEYRTGTFGRSFGWPQEIRTAVGAGPTLLQKGRVALRPYDEGFGDPSLFAVARRSAVGVTSGGKLLLVTVETPITLNKLANIMLRIGAVDAMALDGGSSSALYSNGEFISKPSRALTNLILVYD